MTIQRTLCEEVSRWVHITPQCNNYQSFLLASGYFLWCFQEASLLGFLECLSYVSSLNPDISRFTHTHTGMEYIHLSILIVITSITTLIAPFGMTHLLHSASWSTLYYLCLSTPFS